MFADGRGGSAAAAIGEGTGTTLYVTSVDGSIEALDSHTGRQLWAARIGTASYTSLTPPVRVGPLVYTTANATSMSPALYCFEATTGRLLWSRPLAMALDEAQALAPPTVVSDTVFTGAGTAILTALNAHSGRAMWSIHSVGVGSFATPTVDAGRVFVGANHLISALDAQTGRALWSFRAAAAGPFDGGQTSPAIVVSGTVFVGTGNRVYALEAGTGHKLWEYLTSNSVRAAPVVVRSMVYVSSEDHSLYALAAPSGQKRWSFRAGDLLTAPVVVDATVYVGSRNHRIYALDARTGRLTWIFAAASRVDDAPMVTNGVVCFHSGDPDDAIYALDAASGHLLWSRQTHAMVAPPAMAGLIYLAESTSADLSVVHVLAVEARTGNTLWILPPRHRLVTTLSLALSLPR